MHQERAALIRCAKTITFEKWGDSGLAMFTVDNFPQQFYVKTNYKV